MTSVRRRERRQARFLARTFGLIALGWLDLKRFDDAASAAATAWHWAQTAEAKP